MKNIKKISRLKSYKVKRAAKTESQRSGRGEEWFVLDLFLQKTDKEKVFGELPEFGYQVPIKQICKKLDISRKIIERHRQYIIAVIIIASGDYPCISGYLNLKEDVKLI